MLKLFKRFAPAALLGLLIIIFASVSPKKTPSAEAAASKDPELPKLYINELMASNKATIMDENGAFPDWVELYNAGDESVSLAGFKLSDGNNTWVFPELSIDGGAYMVVFCHAGSRSELYAGFSLSSSGETLRLYTAEDLELDSVSYLSAEADVSYDRSGACEYPTPGYENSEAGYESFSAERRTPALAINEVLVYDTRKANGTKYSDWVELKNNSDTEISLAGWHLSDSIKDIYRAALPDISLAPGETYLFCCSDESFSLDAAKDELYLSSPEAEICDYVSLRGIAYGDSLGRMDGMNGFFYFDEPSPGSENLNGARLYARTPVALDSGGVFNDVSSVRVELSAKGDIYYSLDGSTPNENSIPYTGAFELDHTTVVRAVSIEEGKLCSDVLDISYIINEGHTLPVASLVIDPEDMQGSYGIYNHPTEDWERPASISFFDGEDSFSLKCGLKVHGATSRIAQSKKSYKLVFRNVYDGQLEYDIFDSDTTVFSSVLLRAAQESSFSTNMRDIIFHQLANQCYPGLSTQDYKYCILYINGEYWGIYAFREAHSAEHYANHYGYDADQVYMYRGKWAADCSFEEVYRYMQGNSIRSDESFDYISEHLDIEALIAWSIVESWSGNIDMHAPNVRFYYTAEDDMLHFALVDLDLGFFAQGVFTQAMASGYDYSNVILYLCDNDRFRALMTERLSEYLHGPLSTENALKLIESTADELRDEIPRDGERWGYTLKQWENEIQNYMRDFVTNYGRGGYPKLFADSSKYMLKLGSEDYVNYFGDLDD